MQPNKLSKRFVLFASLYFISTLCFSQVTEQWVKRYNGTGDSTDVARSMAVDGTGNVYVTGSSYGNETNNDYATVKYDAAGNQVWVRRYDSPVHGEDYAADVAVDAAGNVYVTGSSDGKTNEFDFDDHQITTIKYDANGNQLWVKSYNISEDDNEGSEGAVAVALDAAGNVYVAGNSGGGWSAYTTLKYNAAGNQLWVRRYGNTDGNAYVRDLVVDGSGNVHITGFRNLDGYSEAVYATVKYNTNGTQLWARTYNDENEYTEEANDLTVDASGNVYVTGTGSTIKYSSAGSQIWVVSRPAEAVAVDAFGNVYVTGYLFYIDDYTTAKYDAAGNELWEISGFASLLAVDTSGNVYVSGGSTTTKYSTAGALLWTITSNSAKSSLKVGASGNVYITGYTVDNGVDNDYVTIKYSQTSATAVSSFTLINADSDKVIKELKDGDTINLEALSTLNLNIRANTNPDTVGSVVFSLSGIQTRSHTENILPYALYADSNRSNYYSWTPTNGTYTLTATSYSGAKGSGTIGTPLTIHFTVTGQVVSSLILVNAQTDENIKTLKNGDVIDLSTLSTDKLNIRAIVHPDTVGSVVFNMNNRLIVRENLAPYAIGGDIKGDYRAWTLPTGKHVLTATPYSGKYGRGNKGNIHSVNFTVVDMSATAQANVVNSEKAIADGSRIREGSLIAIPNPTSGHTTISFSVPKTGWTMMEVCDMKGAVLERLYNAQAEAGKVYRLPFNSNGLLSGVYMLRLITDKEVQSYKLVVIK